MEMSFVENGTGTETGSGENTQSSGAGEFMILPLDQISVQKQVRSPIDEGSEAQQALVASIREKGVMEPVLVTRQEGGYRLLAGERRLLACRQLGRTSIPARVLENVASEKDILSIQLIENMLRQDLDPIDQGQAWVDYFRTIRKDIVLDEMISHLITYNRAPEKVPGEFSPIIGEIVKYSGKSCNSIINGITLLQLPPEIQEGLKQGVVSLTIGYIFAANMDCPRFLDVYQAFLKSPLTAEALKRRFKQYRDAVRAGKTGTAAAAKPFQNLTASIKSTRAVIEKDVSRYGKTDIEALLLEVEQLGAYLKDKLQVLSAT